MGSAVTDHWVRLLPLVALLALGSSQPPRSLAERARDADRILLAEVLGSAVRPAGEVRRMTTVTTLAVRERYKGAGPDRIELVQLGGKDGLWEAHVAGDATFEPAETVLVFLRCRDPAAPERCTLLGLSEGKLHVARGPLGFEAELREGRRALESVVDEIKAALRAPHVLGVRR